VLAEILGWVVCNLTKLTNQFCDIEEVEALAAAFVIFSKIIKQRPDLFKNLNEIYSTTI